MGMRKKKRKYDEYEKKVSDKWGPHNILKSEEDSILSKKLLFTMMAFKKWIWIVRVKKGIAFFFFFFFLKKKKKKKDS